MTLASTQPEGRLDLTQLSVLVVDDEPMLRSVIQEFLDLMGIARHDAAGDGIEALEMLRREPVDCLLSDIRMPRMELNELLPRLRVEFPDMVVIATSGCWDFESAYNIFLQGAHDFLGKPLNLAALESALGWVVERRALLQEARRLFGPGPQALAPDEAAGRVARLRQAIERGVTHFHPLISHARRLGDLAGLIQPGLDDHAVADLAIAAHLHECGASYQMYVLCQQPRRLDPQELRLVQAHGAIAGGMVARALGRPEFETIIGRQGLWEELTCSQWEQTPRAERLACWLGLLNAVDGWLQDRPDRAGISVSQLREMLQRRLKNNALEPLRRLLDQWSAVETYYAGIVRK